MDLVDSPAPDFTLENTARTEVTLSETLDQRHRTSVDGGPTVVVFFRGYWCSYCAEQLRTFDALAYDLWNNHSVDVLPVTGDPVPRLIEMRDRYDLGFQLLSDPDLSVSERWVGTEDQDVHGAIPRPGTFVVDEDGVVRYGQVGENPADRVYANYVRHAITAPDTWEPYAE